MKLKQNFPRLLAVLAFFKQSFVFVHAANNSIEEQRPYGPDTRVRHSPFQFNFSKQANPPMETIASSPIVVSSSSSSSSSSLLRRSLKKDSPEYFFFEQCSNTCMENNGVPTIFDDCCRGGVSYLKVKFHSQHQINGTITLASTHSPSCDDSQGQLGSKGTKARDFTKSLSSALPSSTLEHRLVDCNASCIQNPFGGNTCDEDQVLNEKKVEQGSELCFAMIKTVSSHTYEIAFGEKMPTDVYVFFLTSQGFSVGLIHTSCSVPLSKSWGIRFQDACTQSTSGRDNKNYSNEKHIKINDNIDDTTPYLSFVDGISTKYFSAVEDVLRAPDTSSYVQDYSIQFRNCGCTCERFNATSSATPSFSPSLHPSTGAYPSSVPSESSTLTPTFVPSLAPSEAPTTSPTTKLSSVPTKVEVVNLSSDPSYITSELPTRIPTFVSSLESSEAPTSPITNLSSIPTKVEVVDPSSQLPTPLPTFLQSLASSEAPATSPTTKLSSMPTKGSVVNSSSNPSTISTEAPTFATTSSSTPTDNPPANQGPGSPSGSTCNSACATFILEQCVFAGTDKACDINSEIPEVSDDDQEEGGVVATLPFVASATELLTASKTGEFSKGTKGKKGFGKDGYGKVGKSGKASKNQKEYKDVDEIISHSENDLPKKSKGKGGEGGQHFSKSGYKRHLKEIEYHQSRIDYFKKLLAYTEA